MNPIPEWLSWRRYESPMANLHWREWHALLQYRTLVSSWIAAGQQGSDHPDNPETDRDEFLREEGIFTFISALKNDGPAAYLDKIKEGLPAFLEQKSSKGGIEAARAAHMKRELIKPIGELTDFSLREISHADVLESLYPESMCAPEDHFFESAHLGEHNRDLKEQANEQINFAYLRVDLRVNNKKLEKLFVTLAGRLRAERNVEPEFDLRHQKSWAKGLSYDKLLLIDIALWARYFEESPTYEQIFEAVYQPSQIDEVSPEIIRETRQPHALARIIHEAIPLQGISAASLAAG